MSLGNNCRYWHPRGSGAVRPRSPALGQQPASRRRRGRSPRPRRQGTARLDLQHAIGRWWAMITTRTRAAGSRMAMVLLGGGLERARSRTKLPHRGTGRTRARPRSQADGSLQPRLRCAPTGALACNSLVMIQSSTVSPTTLETGAGRRSGEEVPASRTDRDRPGGDERAERYRCRGLGHRDKSGPTPAVRSPRNSATAGRADRDLVRDWRASRAA